MRGIAAYKSSNVQSASPQRIIVMLYQAALLRLTKASDALELGEHEDVLAHSRHVRAIITELRAALDHAVAPELCAHLDRIYGWCTLELSQIERADNNRRTGGTGGTDEGATPTSVKEDVERFAGVYKALEVLLDGWEEVARSGGREAA